MKTKLINTAIVILALLTFANAQNKPEWRNISLPKVNQNTETPYRPHLPLVAILASNDSSQATDFGTGVVLSSGPNSVVVTALHIIKDVRFLQLRDADGRIYNDAALLASDERLDLAALQFSGPASMLPVPAKLSGAPGDSVYVVALSKREGPSVTMGSLKSVTIPTDNNASSLYQFVAPLTFDASGGALLDKSGQLVGIVSAARGTTKGQYSAVPMERVMEFASAAGNIFESGTELHLASEASKADKVHNAETGRIAKFVRTFAVRVDTLLIEHDHMIEALRNTNDFDKIDLVMVDDPRSADVLVTVDYIPFTFDYTFKAVDQRTKVVVAAGRVTAFAGYFAAPELAQELVRRLKQARKVTIAKEENYE